MIIFNMAKVITVSDSVKKEHIQELFARSDIKYKIKAKEILQKNPIDTAVIGTFGMNKMKISYSFYVERANLDAAKELLKSI